MCAQVENSVEPPAITRGDFIRRGGATVLGVTALGALAGCGSTQSAAVASGTPKDTLVVPIPSLLQDLDRETTIDAGSFEAMQNVYDPLTFWPTVPFGTGGAMVPELGDTKGWVKNLIEDAAVAKDGVTWTIKFKPGIMSHAGNELTAADYEYWLERHAGMWILGAFYNFVADYLPRNRPKMFRAVDKYTFQGVTLKPSPVYYSMLQNLYAEGPIDSVETKKHATASDPWAAKWVKVNGWMAGHGPYVIESHQPGVQTIYKAFDGYHRGKPRIQKVIHKEVDAASTRAALLRAGQVDIVRDLLPSDYKSLANAPGVVVEDFKKARFLLMFLMMNTTKAPFNDVRVRQALAYAAPYDQIVSAVYQGYADPWNGIISRDYPYFSDAEWLYGAGGNFTKAKELLKAAGLGKGFTINCLSDTSVPESNLVAIQLQTAFSEINVNLRIEQLADAEFTSKLSATQFDTALWQDLALTPDIGYACYLYFRTNAFSNFGKWSDPKADAYVDKILTTLDETERGQIAREFQGYVISQSPQLYLAQPHYVVAHRANVKGITADTSRTLRFSDIYKV